MSLDAAFHDRGWSYEALDAEFPSVIGAHHSVGESFPALPAELQRS